MKSYLILEMENQFIRGYDIQFVTVSNIVINGHKCFPLPVAIQDGDKVIISNEGGKTTIKLECGK